MYKPLLVFIRLHLLLFAVKLGSNGSEMFGRVKTSFKNENTKGLNPLGT